MDESGSPVLGEKKFPCCAGALMGRLLGKSVPVLSVVGLAHTAGQLIQTSTQIDPGVLGDRESAPVKKSSPESCVGRKGEHERHRDPRVLRSTLRHRSSDSWQCALWPLYPSYRVMSTLLSGVGERRDLSPHAAAIKRASNSRRLPLPCHLGMSPPSPEGSAEPETARCSAASRGSCAIQDFQLETFGGSHAPAHAA